MLKRPAESAWRLHLQRRGGQAVVIEALTAASAQIAENFALLLNAQRHAIFAERRPQAPEVAEEIRAAADIAEKAQRRYAGGSRRGRSGAHGLLDELSRVGRRGGIVADGCFRRSRVGVSADAAEHAQSRGRDARAPHSGRHLAGALRRFCGAPTKDRSQRYPLSLAIPDAAPLIEAFILVGQ